MPSAAVPSKQAQTDEPLGHAEGIDLFAQGVHRGTEYTAGDLDQIVANFDRLSGGANPVFRVPLVLGHGEDQEFLQDSGYPAAGWIKKLYTADGTCPQCQGKKTFGTEDGAGPATCPKCQGTGQIKFLKGDADEIPAPLARLINRHAYRQQSAEIYNDFQHNGQSFGKSVRRLALLGAELPQVKDLQDFPRVGYSERFSRPPTGNTFTIFSEAPMGRDEMIAQLLQAGYDQEVLDGMSDEQLTDSLRVLSSQMADMPDDAAMMSMDPAAKRQLGERCKAMSNRFKEYAGKCGAAMGDPAMPAAPVAKTPNPTPTTLSQTPPNAVPPADVDPLKGVAHSAVPVPPPVPNPSGPPMPKKVMMSYSEKDAAALEARIAASEERLKHLDQATAQRTREEKKASISSFCERMVKAGKLLPAELDAGLAVTLEALDAGTVIKFSEKESCTALEKMMRTIESRPNLLKFSEKGKSPSKTAAGDLEVQAVERFAESDQGIQHILAVQGKTPEDHINEFKALLKKNPKITAAQYGVPAQYLVA